MKQLLRLAQSAAAQGRSLRELRRRTTPVMEWGGAGGGGAEDESLWSFGYALAGAVCTVYTGRILIAGVGRYTVAETAVTLTGTTEWVYVRHSRDHAASSIEHASTEPISDFAYYMWPLLYFTGAAGVWTLINRFHRGDIFLASPLQ